MTTPEPTTAPEATQTDAPFMRTIKSYVLRAGRMGTGQMRAFEPVSYTHLTLPTTSRV